MLRFESGLLFRIGLDQPKLFAILIPLLDGHQLMTVDIRIRAIAGARHVNLLLLLDLLLFLRLLALLGLCPFMGGRRGRLVNAILITDAITITVGLAALDLGALLRAGPIAATARSASLRKPVNGQENYGSGKKCAVSQ